MGESVWELGADRDCQKVTLPTFLGGWQGDFLSQRIYFQSLETPT
jgi:hypothetical protein